MKTLVSILCALFLASAGGFGETAPLMRVKVNLADGSVINGTPLFPALILNTEFGRQTIPLELVSTLDFNKDGVKVGFANKDVLSGKINRKFFGVKTVFGVARLPYAQIKKMTFSQRIGGFGETAPPGLLLHAALDSIDENLDIFDAKMEAKNVKIVDGRNGGKAMLFEKIDSKVTVKIPFSPYAMQEGTVEFWAKFPNPNLPFGGNRGQPLFFNFTRPSKSYNNDFLYGFAFNDGGGKSGLIGRMPGVPVTGTHMMGAVSTVASTGLLGNTPGDWHHYAFIWKRDGLDFPGAKGSSLVYVIDGKIVSANGQLPNNPNPTLVAEPGVTVELHAFDSDTARSIVMSDFTIWDKAKIPVIE